MEGERITSPGSETLVAKLARAMINLRAGDRTPTVRELAAANGASVASVHATLMQLQEEGAVTLERRGRAGTVVRERALDRLWGLAEDEPLVIALTLPSNRRFEGLATALKALLTEAGIPAFLIFIRGSRKRLEALRQGRCHVAVMSSFAVAQLGRYEELPMLELHPGSFVADHRVFFVDRDPGAGPLRVVVDPDSVDQQRLTEMEFDGQRIELLERTYIQIARLFEEAQADAAIWTVDEMATNRPEGVRERELSEAVRSEMGDSDTRACLVGRANDVSVRAVMTEVVDPDRLAEIQASVIEGRMVPEY